MRGEKRLVSSGWWRPPLGWLDAAVCDEGFDVGGIEADVASDLAERHAAFVDETANEACGNAESLSDLGNGEQCLIHALPRDLPRPERDTELEGRAGRSSYRARVLGYKVAFGDGSERVVEATAYRVAEDGTLELLDHSRMVGRFEAGAWISVIEVGVRLSDSWPDRRLRSLLDRVREVLAVRYGHYVHLIGSPKKYRQGVFNEVDALASAVLASVGIDVSSSDDRDEIATVRHEIAQVFGVEVPPGPPVPSPSVTAMHCPRCGDRMFRRDGRLWCAAGRMDFSPKVDAELTELVTSEPSKLGVPSSSVRWGGRWFCPFDGFRMRFNESGLPACPSCDRVLQGGLLYQLIEFHMHE